jgi:dihydroflavonol-4-reductase
MRALVVGASGFVGLRVVDALLAAGWEVRVTRRKSTPTIVFGRRPLEVVWASLDELGSLVAAMRGCDVAVIAAGYYPRYSTDPMRAVVTATRTIRNACDAAIATGVRMIYTSSVAALGPARSGELADEDDCAPPDPAEGVYPMVKKSMEAEIDRARDSGLDVVSLLLGGCLGPRDYRLGTNGLLLALLHQKLPFRVDGWINVLSVDDAAAAHVAAIEAPGARYCVAGHNVRFGALLDRAAARYEVELDAPRLSIERARELASEAEAAAEARRERVAFPRELVDLVAMGKPISSARAERDLDLRFMELNAALDASRDWLVRLGAGRRSAPADEKRREHAR